MASMNDVVPGITFPFTTQFTTATVSSSVAAAGDLTGSCIVVFDNNGGTPGTYTTRTATQMIADAGLTLGQVWLIVLVNGQATGTMTLTAGSGVTISGTATVAASTCRVYIAQVTSVSTPAITITNKWAFAATALNFGA